MASGLPKNIEAIALVNEGDFDVINKIVIPIPTPEHDQLLIKVEYSGITFADNCFRTGINPVDKWPHILGEEALGKIVSLPPSPVAVLGREYKKRGFSVGQRVVVKATSQMAEYAVCRWTRAIPLPDTISPENAVPMPTQMYTAFMLVEKVYEIKRGDFVLIHSVAREFGLSLLQMAKLRGATVIGMVSTPANAYIARTHGADHVVLRGYTNVVDRVLTITGGQGVHVSYDSVDKDRAEVESDVRMIKQNGTIVVVGNVSSPRARPTPSASPPTTISNGIKICRPVIHDYLERPAEYLDCAQKANTLVSKGFLQPRIHAVIPFTSEAVRQAERDLLGGNTTVSSHVKRCHHRLAQSTIFLLGSHRSITIHQVRSWRNSGD
ncbi:NAD(P)-binding protein [Cristinia sonorae]|uniref:NAD(P)-binding protein n=1 Tax=Cristinia sonorae TaxID=1940300 RepID=A0A8K0UFZ9_9AGAR|nr:NAD(P)-binding protein [Cristinia sonorae]